MAHLRAVSGFLFSAPGPGMGNDGPVGGNEIPAVGNEMETGALFRGARGNETGLMRTNRWKLERRRHRDGGGSEWTTCKFSCNFPGGEGSNVRKSLKINWFHSSTDRTGVS